MLQFAVDKWNKNKDKLKKYFEETPQAKYLDYSDIFKLVLEIILNDSDYEYNNYDTEHIHIIDDGHYQGMQIFIAHKKTYQPGCSDYIITHNYYGSCSGCDTLMSIYEFGSGLPNKQQVGDYMKLSLGLIQSAVMLDNTV